MSVFVHDRTDKRIAEVEKLHARAKKWTRKIACRKCGAVFSFDATDLAPGRGDYGGWDFHSPHLDCPLCGTYHSYWWRGHFFSRWIGRYIQLRYELKDVWEPSEPDRIMSRLIDTE